MNQLKNVNDVTMCLNENDLLHVIMYRNKNFDKNMHISILTVTMKIIKDSRRFGQSLF